MAMLSTVSEFAGHPVTVKKTQRDEKKDVNLRTIVISGFPKGTKDVHIKKLIPSEWIEKIAWPPLSSGKGMTHTAISESHVLVKNKRYCGRALKLVRQHTIEGNHLSATLLSRMAAKAKCGAKIDVRRLVIRNLPFKCTKEELQTTFGEFGTINHIVFPSHESEEGKCAGYSFIEYSDKESSAKAIESMTGKTFLGRRLAVDYAVPKKEYVALKKKRLNENGKLTKNEDGDEQIYVERNNPFKADSVKTEHVRHSRNRVDIDSADEIEEDIDEAEEEENDSDGDTSSSEESDYGSNAEGRQESKTGGGSADAKRRRKSNDVKEEKTLFVRNLPFETTDSDLEEAFEDYGEVEYARVVVDKQSERSKGVGFVKFKEKAAADECIQLGDQNMKGAPIRLEGRVLNICRAISQSEIQRNNQVKNKKADRRNLKIAFEGIITRENEASMVLSESEMRKRERIIAAKKAKLKNSNIFVSDVRLCVHNIPRHVTSSELKSIMKEATGNAKNTDITECRIMEDRNQKRPVNADRTAGRSLGYAFVTFTTHKDALAALRYTNNNPDIFGDKKRPIVEFSLENTVALQLKQKRFEKSKTRQKANNESPDLPSSQAAHKSHHPSPSAGAGVRRTFVVPTRKKDKDKEGTSAAAYLALPQLTYKQKAKLRRQRRAMKRKLLKQKTMDQTDRN